MPAKEQVTLGRIIGMTLLTGLSVLLCYAVFVWAMSGASAVEDTGGPFSTRASLYRAAAVVPIAMAGLAALVGWWRTRHPLKWAAITSMLTAIVLLLWLGVSAGGF
ncbi:hypothetical protein [Planotetraspora phitsanulokensis]|nr:hypothetical protein [Planotetraspora phitsanulokensis]